MFSLLTENSCCYAHERQEILTIPASQKYCQVLYKLYTFTFTQMISLRFSIYITLLILLNLQSILSLIPSSNAFHSNNIGQHLSPQTLAFSSETKTIRTLTKLDMVRKSVSNIKRFQNHPFLQPTPTNIIIYLNIIIFILQKFYPIIQFKLMKIDRLITRGQTYRFLTACFAHGSFMHIGFNCYSLYSLGPQAEAMFGKLRFLTFYLLSGIFGNMATYAFKTSPFSLGASGCIWGLLGCMATFYYRNQEILGSSAAMSNPSPYTLIL